MRARIGRRYVQALGAGVAVEAIQGELVACEVRARALEADLARLAPLPARAGLNREALRTRLAEWHGLLRQTPAIARQLLRKLLPEPLVLEPILRFRGRAAWAAVLTGVLHSACLVVPPEGTEYLYTVEVREIIKAA